VNQTATGPDRIAAELAACSSCPPAAAPPSSRPRVARSGYQPGPA